VTPAPALGSDDLVGQEPPVAFDPVDRPDVSIIVPVYGKLDLTAQCLRSISMCAETSRYEVIVIDDASPDATPMWLAQCSGIRVLTNSENIGFLRSVNKAAATARGEVLCLLNNDTEVTTGWLDALVRRLQSAEDIAMVGAKLLFGDGRVQEAGSVIFADASTRAVGTDQKAKAPRLNFVREVDYCSGACLAIRSSVWRELGGFDERFAPAYYEEADLAMAARSTGWRVLYEPAAVVVHHHRASYGRSEAESLQLRNREVFRDKWSDVLAEHPAVGAPLSRAGFRDKRPRLLVLTGRAPDDADLDLGAVATNVAEAGVGLTVVTAGGVRRPHQALQEQGVEVMGSGETMLMLHERSRQVVTTVIVGLERAIELIPVVRRMAPHGGVVVVLSGDDQADDEVVRTWLADLPKGVEVVTSTPGDRLAQGVTMAEQIVTLVLGAATPTRPAAEPVDALGKAQRLVDDAPTSALDLLDRLPPAPLTAAEMLIAEFLRRRATRSLAQSERRAAIAAADERRIEAALVHATRAVEWHRSGATLAVLAAAALATGDEVSARALALEALETAPHQSRALEVVAVLGRNMHLDPMARDAL
jgi:GT2 family glycosyltransferase